jgi:NAD(P)-dependent dehydrogenase (short-subunit alcohol dehydrogenase family)
VLITGSTDGLGREVAKRVGAFGGHVIVNGRNAERGAAVVAEISATDKGSARFYQADFASLAQVREFANALLRDYTRIDVIVNNAGVWGQGNERQLTADGHELHFGVNYLSGFLLTRTLLPLLPDSGKARVVNVASIAQTPIDFDNVMLATGYTAGRGYGQSKLAQILFTFDLAEELKPKGATVTAVHPATMMNTTMVLSRGAQARSSVEEGADAVVQLSNAAVGTGEYFNGLIAARANAQAYDGAARERLRTLSLALSGAPAPGAGRGR